MLYGCLTRNAGEHLPFQHPPTTTYPQRVMVYSLKSLTCPLLSFSLYNSFHIFRRALSTLPSNIHGLGANPSSISMDDLGSSYYEALHHIETQSFSIFQVVMLGSASIPASRFLEETIYPQDPLSRHCSHTQLR